MNSNSVIKPLTIGSLQFPINLIQGPLAGFSCSAFRRLFHHYQAPAYCVTEMISAHDLCTKINAQHRLLHRAKEEAVLSYQIASNCPQEAKKAVEKLIPMGANLINLNCGCPKPKIRKKGRGTALLEKPERLCNILKAMKANSSVPITAKIRLVETQTVQATLALVRQLEDCGIDALIVHGRHWTESYEDPVRIDHLAAVKDSLTIPMIVNGDIHNFASLERLLIQTGANGAMIARAGTGKPWLYHQLICSAQNSTFSTPNTLEIWQKFREHLIYLAELEGEKIATFQSRKFLKYYFPNQFQQFPLRSLFQFESIAPYLDALKEILIAAEGESVLTSATE